MAELNQALLILHFVGLALGLSVSFANFVMSGLIGAAAPAEKAVLGRFPPRMTQLGRIGLTVLWATGATLVYTKWGGFAALPWQFHAKLTAVVLLTVVVVYIYLLERRIRSGDASALPRIETAGKAAIVLALIAVVFAVLTFD